MVIHFRPITLCNVCYKIIAKILVNRLRPLLDKFISPLQGAFVPQRAISDNILIAHKLIHKIKKKNGKTGLMTVKLDIKKAYDKMEWNFLLAILRKLGFCDQ